MKDSIFALSMVLCVPFALNAFAEGPIKDQVFAEDAFISSWESLAAWECPEWFKDAKFGIWVHWRPQCEAEDGEAMHGHGLSLPSSSMGNPLKRMVINLTQTVQNQK